MGAAMYLYDIDGVYTVSTTQDMLNYFSEKQPLGNVVVSKGLAMQP